MPRRKIPEVVGLAEVAEILKTRRQQALRWSKRPDFPQPVAELQAGRIWLKEEVARWARQKAGSNRG